MTRVLKAAAALVALGLAAAALIALSQGPDPRGPAGSVQLDHGGRVERAELDRVLLAAEAVSASTPRAELEARGRELFESSSEAKPGEACASCHVIGGGVNSVLGQITHRRDPSRPLGPENFTGPREAPALWGVARTAPYNWVGGNRTLEDQAVSAVTTHFRNEGTAATAERVAALVAYMRTLKAPVTRHDEGRLTQTELAGEEIFVGKGGCIACHGGPDFTDNQLHRIDVPQATIPRFPESDDPGSGGIPGAFNTPGLRDVANTAPYMHNGRFQTLADVVDFYASNPLTGGPLRLTADERAALVAYLRTL